MKILFVCLGNICRSPLAEAIFKHKVKAAGLGQQVGVDSCGTSDYHIGEQPDSRTIRNALKNGITIEHRGRQLTEDDLATFDLVLAMDKSNLRNINLLRNAAEHQHKIKLMRAYDPEQNGDEVPDPYYGGERGFQEVFEILDRSTDMLLSQLQQDLQR